MTSYPPDRYKRRFLVEFTPAESDLLDRLGLQRGTKRRAILDGLQLLESGELETLRTRVAALEGERDAAAAAAAAATEELAEAGEVQEKLKTTTALLRAERAALKSARAELREANEQLATTRHDLATAHAEIGRLVALLPDHAFCAACRKYVPASEWAEQPDAEGRVHVYHRPHGLRTKATLTQPPSLLFWRAAPTEPVR